MARLKKLDVKVCDAPTCIHIASLELISSEGKHVGFYCANHAGFFLKGQKKLERERLEKG